jgi:hypothetical protein
LNNVLSPGINAFGTSRPGENNESTQMPLYIDITKYFHTCITITKYELSTRVPQAYNKHITSMPCSKIQYCENSLFSQSVGSALTRPCADISPTFFYYSRVFLPGRQTLSDNVSHLREPVDQNKAGGLFRNEQKK